MSSFWSDDPQTWPAPAKLNVFLHIVGRRDDGYHLLQTAFQFLDFGDSLDFAVRDDGQVTLSGGLADVPLERDLCVRAAQLLKAETGCRSGVDIHLRKRTPTGGGLGGGSSDAATTLCALNQLWQLNLAANELAVLGLRLGADVPVFVRGYAAWAEGVGELLEPIAIPEPWYLVITPACAVPTAQIFAVPELARNTPPITLAEFLQGQDTRNDCEPVVRKLYPEVDAAMHWLGEHADAKLTGTGSSVFAAFDSERQAQAVADRVPAPWQKIVARGSNMSALSARIRAHR